MMHWKTTGNISTFSSTIKTKRELHYQRYSALLRLILTYSGLSLYVFLSTLNTYTLFILIAIAVYSTIVFLFKPLQSLVSSMNLLTVCIDETLIFLVCFYTGGLESPCVLAFFLPVIFYAINSVFKHLLKLIIITVIYIITLGLATGYVGNYYIYLTVFLIIVGIFVNIIVNTNFEILSKYAIKDGLTGLYTHQFFFDQLRELANEKSKVSIFSVIMIDLDEFKLLNDKYGHIEGDRVLKAVAKTIMLNVRKSDIVARYGGDEFAIILPGVGHELCNLIVQRLQRSIIDLGYFNNVSIGSAQYPEEAKSIEDLVDLADTRMYAQKKSKIPLQTISNPPV